MHAWMVCWFSYLSFVFKSTAAAAAQLFVFSHGIFVMKSSYHVSFYWLFPVFFTEQ